MPHLVPMDGPFAVVDLITPAVINQPLTLSAARSTDSDPIVSYTWSDGKGFTTTTKVPSLTVKYAVPCVHYMMLTVTDTKGTSNAVFLHLDVTDPTHVFTGTADPSNPDAPVVVVGDGTTTDPTPDVITPTTPNPTNPGPVARTQPEWPMPATIALGKTIAKPSSQGRFGQAYYANGDHSLAVNVLGAAYRAERYTINNSDPATADQTIPSPDQKFLVVTFRVTNTATWPVDLRYDTVKFHITDADGNGSDSQHSLYNAGDHLDTAHSLAPGESADVQVYDLMSNTSPAASLDVTADDPNVHTVYGLTPAIVAPLPVAVAPVAPADFPTEVPAQANNFYPVGVFNVSFQSLRHGRDPVQRMLPDAGSEYAFIYLKVRNGTGGDRTLNYDQIHVTLTDADSDRTYDASTPLGDDLSDVATTYAPMGQAKSEGWAIYAIQIPLNMQIASLRIREGDSHVLVYRDVH